MPSTSPSEGHKIIGRIELRNIVKYFPGVTANDGISLDIMAGEIHTLLGENGAGKSTLMRQLYGMYRPDGGEILIDEEPRSFRSPADAVEAGISMIHQHFMLVQTLTVAQNVTLGNYSRGLLLDTNRTVDQIRSLSEKYGLHVDPDAFVWQLSVGEQQRVEIIKTLYLGAGLIILDEPTAVLTPNEVTDLFETLRRLADEGHLVVFISHKLHEVMTISDRITVLRDGKVVGSHRASEVTRGELVRQMVGRELKEIKARPVLRGPVHLSVRGLHAAGDRGGEALKGVDLEVRAGEIVGIAGVSGNGQRELAECLAGVRKVSAGNIEVNGVGFTHASLNARIRGGMAFIPEERMRDGAIRDFTVQENVFLHDHREPEFSRSIFLKQKAMNAHAKRLVADFAVRTPSLDTPLKNLSGGNIQKLIMARELSRNPAVLVAAQPTRGVDIGASEYIHERLLAQRETGTAILLISEDLDEIRSLSDRVAVMYEGRITGVVERGKYTIDQIGLMMAGTSMEDAIGSGA
jgi:simple sugar transport system ATP-binding protein